MIKENLEVKNKLGIHARPAALLAQEAGKYKSKIFIAKDGVEVNVKSIMGIMMLAAEHGCKLTLCIDGPDEIAAQAGLRAAFGRIFEEDFA